jgi:signal transduction histidine kinase
MKIGSKTYLLIGILIAVAAFNLFLLQQAENSVGQSYSVIKAGDIKVKSESISGLAISVANGNVDDKEKIEKEIDEVELIITALKNGGPINGNQVVKFPISVTTDYEHVPVAWENFKTKVLQVEKTSVFDQEAINAMNYVLQKNQDLVLFTNGLVNDLERLDRNFNTHKQISEELAECAKIIGQQTLLISIGEGEKSQGILKEKRLQFEIGMRKLLQISTEGLDVQRFGMTHDSLDPVPKENGESLRQLDPLWESVQVKIQTVEERARLSQEFNVAKNQMNEEKQILFEHTNHLVDAWSRVITSEGSEGQVIIQILLVVDLAVFALVVYVIRKSLSPLESIMKAMSKVKEGIYDEKIGYSGDDEIGQLVSNFNIMSNTIKEKEEEAKKTDIAKDEFLAMITHELKTPLVPIQGYSDILLSEHLGKLNVKQKERIGIIKSSSEALLSIISDLLDAQKLELGQLRMRKENKNIKDTIDKAVESLIPVAERNNIEIKSNILDMQVNHDPVRISQVVTNLIKNSLIAVQPNSGKIKVSIESLPTAVKVSIEDNGIGIPHEKQKNLFTKFYQVDATLTREKGGSGLGLAICKGIINNHGGEITMQSAATQGAIFSFTIPKEESDQKKSPIGTS